MDKFGSSRSKQSAFIPADDLDMNRYRIVNLDDPKDSCDAVTKQYLHKQLRENDLTDTMKVVVQRMERDFQALRDEMGGVKLQAKKVDALEKTIEKLNMTKVDRTECVSTNGGKVNVDLDMQKHHLRNLPLPREDGEPVSKISFSILEDEIAKIKESIDALRTYVQLKHTSGRSRRRLSESDDVSRYEVNIDALAKTLSDRG